MRSASPEIIFRFYARGDGAEQISAQIAAWRFRMSVSSAERVSVIYLFSRVRHAVRKALPMHGITAQKIPPRRSICRRRDFRYSFFFRRAKQISTVLLFRSISRRSKAADRLFAANPRVESRITLDFKKATTEKSRVCRHSSPVSKENT